METLETSNLELINLEESTQLESLFVITDKKRKWDDDDENDDTEDSDKDDKHVDDDEEEQDEDSDDMTDGDTGVGDGE